VLFVVRGLREDSKGVYIRLRILERYNTREVKTKDGEEHKVTEVLAGDRTGTIILTLWDELSQGVEAGDLVDLTNGYTNRFRGRLRLNIGHYGSITKVEDPNFPSKEEILRRYRRWKKREEK